MARLKVTYVRSVIGQKPDQERTVQALGLRRLHQMVEHEDSPQLRGMVRKVRHLVKVEELS
jgi:large subunit ribosomal protein L30